MKRTIDQWRNCKPSTMVTQQSEAALTFALEDAKSDIQELYQALEKIIASRQSLVDALKKDCQVSNGFPHGSRPKKLKYTDAQCIQVLAIRYPHLSKELQDPPK